MHFASTVIALVLKFGGIGLLVLGILDSSYLFAPWGNDLLVVAMTANNPKVAMMLYYATMSAVGSVLGCLLIDLTLRPLGAKGLEKYLSARTLRRVKSRMKEKAGVTLALTSLLPPPFPFTGFVMAASALQYPRARFVAVIGITRLIRFAILGALALRYGETILSWAKNPYVQRFLVLLIIVCVVGSIVSVYGWIRRSRA